MNPQQSSENHPQPKAVEAPDSKQSDQSRRFPVVGIGASAGGLDAFRQLLSHLPTDTAWLLCLFST